VKLSVVALALAAVAALAGIVWLAGVSPVEAGAQLLKGTLGSEAAFSGTLREMTPLILAGIAVFLALRAGLFNIGVEGQLILGAVSSAAIAMNVPGYAGIFLGILGGSAAGAVWALPAGWIRAYRGGHEVITTIMLNNIAAFFTTALVAGPLKGAGQESTTTATLPAASMIGNLFQSGSLKINWGLAMSLFMLVAAGFWLARTVSGFELRLVGANPRASELAGVDRRRAIVGAMALSGAVGGFAGAIQVLAYEGRFYSGFSPGYGFDALGVALLAGSSPFGIIPSAFLFAMLGKGSTSIQILGVPKGITYIVLGLIILVYAAVRYRRSERVD
jgi:simple sugar transport system permease protein